MLNGPWLGLALMLVMIVALVWWCWWAIAKDRNEKE
jgi:hypothetical protein